jgi:ATP phosphoribosyltransferase
VLKLVLPSGSLQKGTMDLFNDANLKISTPDPRCYEANVDDFRIGIVRWMRPQEIPLYVSEGLFDIGIGGYDWVIERGCRDKVEIVARLNYSRNSNKPVRLIVAVSALSGIQTVDDIKPGSRVTTEYVAIAEEYFQRKGIPVNIEFSFGTTEAKIPEIADVLVDLTESGSSLKANNLQVIDTIMESSTVVMANKNSWADPKKRQHIVDVVTLLSGALDARGKVLVKMNVSKDKLKAVLDILPSMKNPTISTLSGDKSDYYAVESVAEKEGMNILIPKLKLAGAEDIIELPISKVIK